MEHYKALESLEVATTEFFHRHWNSKLLGAAPTWKFTQSRFKGSVPNYDKAGCYALFENSSLVYIGTGRDGAEVEESSQRGISRRLMSHVLQSSNLPMFDYEPKGGREKITGIATIGFEKDHNYMALALECYLINTVNPSTNIQH